MWICILAYPSDEQNLHTINRDTWEALRDPHIQVTLWKISKDLVHMAESMTSRNRNFTCQNCYKTGLFFFSRNLL
ncbi:hypothetical protein HETIRDRAFT_169558 [Heterobasidion irregulare TC 32-1]|uniref:Uncharacterized protein n=1 Tax=Heterobasidion irregulare (strain TC 32-1) TaxID=747525 RepID=W4K658_HETIT|nr:uncharacterized protein HETIRDRAFT_169558 [Heterobasidion irregulare TC 32-1]ETW80820.1 hypothetical protein HETIRDRAFT_169558 [Heterobasidion irregulare TC 32-1]